MSDFINIINVIDNDLLLWINSQNSPIMDTVMNNISGKLFWLPLYVFLVVFIFYKRGLKQGIISLIFISLIILTVDQFCASFIRPIIGRLRPSSPDNPISYLLHFVNDHRGGSFGFPSCHAANTFALATFVSCLIKDRTFSSLILTWAIIVSYSRMYLGMHYPTDIVCGALIGILFAYSYYKLFEYIISLTFSFPSKRYFNWYKNFYG